MDNAFERARAAYGTGAYDDATLEFLFPQLKESEDEQVRKAMLQHFKNKTKEKWCNIPVKDIISWLEKQKDHFRDDTKMVEQKPAEWSEEDKFHQASIIGCIEFCKKDGTEQELGIYDSDIDWLKSLCSQQKVEWSEEDSKRYVSIGTTLETSVVLSKEDYDANMSWLHNLVNSQKYSHPQPHWKPSEEQMEALKKVAYSLIGSGTETDIHLAELYEQLKQL